MLNINEIIEEYRKGDFEKRLSFFLEYRDIREEFMQIIHEQFQILRRPYCIRSAENPHGYQYGAGRYTLAAAG